MALPAVTNPADAPGLIFRMGVGTLYPLARILTRFDHHGGENLPGPGPALIVSNHISNYDPVVLGAFLVANGRWPHWLAKKELFQCRSSAGWPRLVDKSRSTGKAPTRPRSSTTLRRPSIRA